MAKRRVLIVGDEGIALFLTNGKKIEHECSLPWVLPEFEEELIKVLKGKNNSTPVFILYDALEQQYRKENIIKTNILDQKKLVKRKLSTLFPNVLSYSYIELKDKNKKKKKSKSKDDADKDTKQYLSYLVAAVPNTEQMDKIEYAITEANCGISGFALLPVESSSFAKEFTKKIYPKNSKLPRWTLLISHHETGGLRQIFIKDGSLVLTRLTPFSSEGNVGTKWAEEVYKGFTTTLSYISRFGFQPADGLDVIVVCNAENKSLLQTYDFKNANLHCYSTNEVAKLFNFTISNQQNDNNQFAEILHAGWLARQRKLIMPFKIGWIQNISIPKNTAKAATFILFLALCGAAFISFETWQEYEEIKKEISYKETIKRSAEKEYEQESKIFDALPIKPVAIKAALETKEALDKYSMVSYPILDKIKLSLGNKVKLLSVSYKDNRTPEENFKKKKTRVWGLKKKKKAKNTNHLNILVKFTFEEAIPVEERVKLVNSIKDEFVKNFPERIVKIEQQYGGKEKETKAFSGKLSDLTEDMDKKKKNINPADNYAEISISGEHL